MMKSIFFDSYDTPLLRIDSLREVHNNSQLVVGPGTVAYISDGDKFYGPLYPGVHNLETEIGWFRNGVHGRSMTVYRIGTRESYYCRSGTGLFQFEPCVIPITCSARAPYTMIVRIADGDLFIKEVLGYRPQPGQEALDQQLTTDATGRIQNALKSALNRQGLSAIDLVSVAEAVARDLRPEFRKCGIDLVTLTISEINMIENKSLTELETELARLKALCGNDKSFFLLYSLVKQGKATASDLMAMGSLMAQNDTAPPDTWGGL